MEEGAVSCASEKAIVPFDSLVDGHVTSLDACFMVGFLATMKHPACYKGEDVFWFTCFFFKRLTSKSKFGFF